MLNPNRNICDKKGDLQNQISIREMLKEEMLSNDNLGTNCYSDNERDLNLLIMLLVEWVKPFY